ncbi:MAG: GNAT family N-acetyltransferase [Ruminococcus sp.]|nr:GNAT family N-acetyltransferase [Ruminococcus sp.]
MIRKAKMSDIPQLAEIYKQLHSIHCEIRSDYYKMPSEDFFTTDMEKLLNSEEITVIVSECNSEIAGYTLIYFIEKGEPVNYNLRKCHIEQLAVNEKYRRKGIGTGLITYIKKLAAEKECQSVELGVWCENNNAVEFYSEMGFVPRTYTMEMKIL